MKGIVFKKSLKNREAHNLFGLIRDSNDSDMNTYIPICKLVIESWPFDGSPQDDAAYENLEFLDMSRIAKAINEWLNKYLSEDALKN